MKSRRTLTPLADAMLFLLCYLIGMLCFMLFKHRFPLLSVHVQQIIGLLLIAVALPAVLFAEKRLPERFYREGKEFPYNPNLSVPQAILAVVLMFAVIGVMIPLEMLVEFVVGTSADPFMTVLGILLVRVLLRTGCVAWVLDYKFLRRRTDSHSS